MSLSSLVNLTNPVNLFQCVNGWANFTGNRGKSGKRSTWYCRKICWLIKRNYFFPSCVKMLVQGLLHCGIIIFSITKFWISMFIEQKAWRIYPASYSNLLQDTGPRFSLNWLLFNHCMQTYKARTTILISQYIETKLDFDSLWALSLSDCIYTYSW